MALNKHHSLFLISHFIHVSILTRKLWPPEVSRPSAGKSKVVGQKQVWVCWEVGMASAHLLSFTLFIVYVITFLDLTF